MSQLWLTTVKEAVGYNQYQAGYLVQNAWRKFKRNLIYLKERVGIMTSEQ